MGVDWNFKTLERDFLKAKTGSKRRLASDALSKYSASRPSLMSNKVQFVTVRHILEQPSRASTSYKSSFSCFKRSPSIKTNLISSINDWMRNCKVFVDAYRHLRSLLNLETSSSTVGTYSSIPVTTPIRRNELEFSTTCSTETSTN